VQPAFAGQQEADGGGVGQGRKGGGVEVGRFVEDEQSGAGAGQEGGQAVEGCCEEGGGPGLGPEEIEGIEDQGGQAAAAGQGLRCSQRFRQVVAGAHQQAGEVEATAMGIVGVEAEGLVDISHLTVAPLLLGLLQELEGQGRLARGRRAEQFADASLGQAADDQGVVEGRESGGDVGGSVGARAAQRFSSAQGAGAEALLEGGHRHVQLALYRTNVLLSTGLRRW